MEKLQNKGWLIFISLTFLIFSCGDKEPKLTLKREKSSAPYFHTNLEVAAIDSILFIKYKKDKIIDSTKICIKNVYEDTGYNTKWRFQLCDSLEVGFDFKLIFDINGKKNTYLFSDIEYDTVSVYKGHIYKTK